MLLIKLILIERKTCVRQENLCKTNIDEFGLDKMGLHFDMVIL